MGAATTKAELSEFMAKTLAPVFESILKRVERIEQRAAETERRSAQRVQRLEGRMDAATGLRYLGVHDDGEAYEPGDAVTHGGSLWIAKERTSAKPGIDGTWQLAVKRGKDGRDARATP